MEIYVGNKYVSTTLDSRSVMVTISCDSKANFTVEEKLKVVNIQKYFIRNLYFSILWVILITMM